jgi:hypothetical protein
LDVLPEIGVVERQANFRVRMQDGNFGKLVSEPVLYDSSIHYFSPVYPDAIHARVRAPHTGQLPSAPGVSRCSGFTMDAD